MKAYYVTGTVLNIVYILSHLIPTKYYEVAIIIPILQMRNGKLK